MKPLSNKQQHPSVKVLVLLALLSPPIAQADWWQETKETATEVWESTTQTLKGWTQQAEESENIQSLKSEAGEVAERLTEPETYQNAWKGTKETVGEVTQNVQDSQTFQSLKQGAGELSETLTDKQTYESAWESAKSAATSAKDSVQQTIDSMDQSVDQDQPGGKE